MKLKYKLVASYLLILAAILVAGVYVESVVTTGYEDIAIKENADWAESYFLHEAEEHDIPALLRSDVNITQQLEDWKHVVATENVMAIRLWDRNFTIRHAANATLVGRRFPTNKDLSEAYQGDTVSELVTDQSEETVQAQGGLLELYVPIKDSDGVVIGVGEMYVNFTDAHATIQTAKKMVWDTFATVTISLTILLLILGYFLWRPLRDLSQMQSVMDSLSRGDFDVELAATDRRDEIGEISRSFERLLTSLKLAMKQTHTSEDEK